MHHNRLWIIAALLGMTCVFYMTYGARGSWDFILPYRGTKLAGLLLVAVSVSTATVLFQTVTQNRILTPSIMGFDSLYLLLLTGLVYVLGGQVYVQLPPFWTFISSTALMAGASFALFATLLLRGRQDIMRLILTGIVFGVLFQSLTSFMQRMIDPNEYSHIQSGSFASFTQIEPALLGITFVLTAIAIVRAWALRHSLDVLALGHDSAINLGLNPKRLTLQTLILIAVLVSVSTALVGPIAFLGLLVVSLARLVTPTPYHGVLLPSAALLSAITLVGGQTILERVFALSTPLSVVVDVAGGLLFLFLLLRGIAK